MTALLPLVAVFAHFLPYNGERIGLSAPLVPALLLIVFSVWAMGSLATALSTRFNLVSNLLLCSVLFILGLMSDYLIGRNSLEKWEDVPSIKSKAALWMSSYTFAPTELAYVGRWEKPEKIDQRETLIVWSSAAKPRVLPVNLGKNPAAIWNDSDDWKNDLSELSDKPVVMATYNVETQTWDQKTITGERNLVPSSAKGMDAAFTSYIFRRSDNPPRTPTGGTYLYPYPKTGSWLATAVYAAVPNWQLFWMADALSNKLTVPVNYILYGAAYTIVMNIMLMLLAIILFWEREVGKQIIT